MNPNVFEFYIDACLPSLSFLPWLSRRPSRHPSAKHAKKEDPENTRSRPHQPIYTHTALWVERDLDRPPKTQ